MDHIQSRARSIMSEKADDVVKSLLDRHPTGSLRPFWKFVGPDGVARTFDLSKLSPQQRVEFRVHMMLQLFSENLSPQAHAPIGAEKLLSLLVTPNRLEEAIGDFDDGYHREVKRHGIYHAKRWYYWQVFMLVVRGIFDAASSAAKLWLGLG
jgi:hypothetical protein